MSEVPVVRVRIMIRVMTLTLTLTDEPSDKWTLGQVNLPTTGRTPFGNGKLLLNVFYYAVIK